MLVSNIVSVILCVTLLLAAVNEKRWLYLMIAIVWFGYAFTIRGYYSNHKLWIILMIMIGINVATAIATIIWGPK